LRGRVQQNEVIVTQWGDYEIVVSVTFEAELAGPNGITAKYEILRFGRCLANDSIPATYHTPSDAAESALRIAKLDARASLDGPFPIY
jgi:hypothetical protein